MWSDWVRIDGSGCVAREPLQYIRNWLQVRTYHRRWRFVLIAEIQMIQENVAGSTITKRWSRHTVVYKWFVFYLFCNTFIMTYTQCDIPYGIHVDESSAYVPTQILMTSDSNSRCSSIYSTCCCDGSLAPMRCTNCIQSDMGMGCFDPCCTAVGSIGGGICECVNSMCGCLDGVMQ